MTLTEKYRPTTFEAVVGQAEAVEWCRGQIGKPRAGSVVFHGPTGTGKTTIAYLYAAALLCENRQASGSACRHCGCCRAFAAGNALNCFIEDCTKLDLSAVAHLVEISRANPLAADYRVFVFDEAQRLSPKGFDSLLTVLERPRRNVFIFMTTDSTKIPETSRNSPASTALTAAKIRVSAARNVIQSIPVRPLACYEQDELLTEALDEASSTLFVTTAGLRPLKVNGQLLRQLDRLAEAGVKVEIEALVSSREERKTGLQFDPLAELEKRAQKGSLVFRQGERRDFYILIKDDDLAVVSSRPFFGEIGRRSGFARVEGLVLRGPDQVKAIWQGAGISTRQARLLG